MPREVFSPKTDIIFKKMFTENRDMLHNFLAAMLGIPEDDISDINMIKDEIPPEDLSGKFTRFDLSMTVDERLVNVEVQVKHDANFRDRALLYWAKLFSSGIKSGEEYDALKQTITINIINFKMFRDKNFHHEVNPVVKDTGEIFSDKFVLHFMELGKLKKTINTEDMRELWLQFINAESEEVFRMIEQTNIPIMKKAVRVVYDMSEETAVKEAVRRREKALHDEATAIGAATRKGMAKGLAKGRTEGKAEGRAERDIEFAAKLRAKGMSEEEIKEFLE